MFKLESIVLRDSSCNFASFHFWRRSCWISKKSQIFLWLHGHGWIKNNFSHCTLRTSMMIHKWDSLECIIWATHPTEHPCHVQCTTCFASCNCSSKLTYCGTKSFMQVSSQAELRHRHLPPDCRTCIGSWETSMRVLFIMSTSWTKQQWGNQIVRKKVDHHLVQLGPSEKLAQYPLLAQKVLAN